MIHPVFPRTHTVTKPRPALLLAANMRMFPPTDASSEKPKVQLTKDINPKEEVKFTRFNSSAG